MSLFAYLTIMVTKVSEPVASTASHARASRRQNWKWLFVAVVATHSERDREGADATHVARVIS
jgi:hypothetical protein